MHSRSSKRNERAHPRPCLKRLPQVELENAGMWACLPGPSR